MKLRRKIKLGSKVVDKVSGLRGIAIGRAKYLYASSQISVAEDTAADPTRATFRPPVPEPIWIDEARLEVVT